MGWALAREWGGIRMGMRRDGEPPRTVPSWPGPGEPLPLLGVGQLRSSFSACDKEGETSVLPRPQLGNLHHVLLLGSGSIIHSGVRRFHYYYCYYYYYYYVIVVVITIIAVIFK